MKPVSYPAPSRRLACLVGLAVLVKETVFKCSTQAWLDNIRQTPPELRGGKMTATLTVRLVKRSAHVARGKELSNKSKTKEAP